MVVHNGKMILAKQGQLNTQEKNDAAKGGIFRF
jgi:hypothetical protein